MAAAIGGALTNAAIQMIAPVSETLTQVLQVAITDFFSGGSDDTNLQDSVIRVRCGVDDGGAENDLGKPPWESFRVSWSFIHVLCAAGIFCTAHAMLSLQFISCVV